MSRLVFLFIYTLCLALCIPPLFPHLHLLFFAPFLVWTFYRKNKIACLWIALISGIFVDLMSTQTRLGHYAFNYCLTTGILYNYRRHLFEDSATTLPFMTFIFSLVSAFNQAILFYIFGYKAALSWAWIKSDLIQMPLLDALYAGIAFSFPALFFSRPLPSNKSSVLFSPKRMS